MKKQGGEIKVQSELGVGTTFQFTLPFKKGNQLNIPKKTINDANGQKGKELLRGTKILVFEGNHLNQNPISEQLKKLGCKVFVTADAQKGLGLLGSQPMDIVLMDLKIQGTAGFEVAKKIKTNQNSSVNSIPIITIGTAYTPQDQENGVTAGIDDFILEPYVLDELLLKILKHKKEKALTPDSKALLKTKRVVAKKPTDIKLDRVYEDCFQEIEVLSELIRLFKQNVFEFIGAVRIHLENKDLKEVGLAAHKLKAGLAMLYAEHLRGLIIAMEAGCKNNDEAEVGRLFHEFLDAYPENETAINEQLAHLKNKA